jgi:thioesterase domain-containing protein
MARLIAEKGPMGSKGPIVVQLQRGKAGPPVYFINAGSWEVRLAQLMGEEHPVFGIEVPWPLAWHKATSNNQTSVLPNLEQLVAPYVEAVIAQTGSSSCVLAGYSFWGLMAFEAAHQLQRRGVKLDMVMLLDSWLRLPPRYLVSWNKWQHDWKEGLTKLVKNQPHGSIGFLRKSRLFVAMLAQRANTIVSLLKKKLLSSKDAVLTKPIELSKLDEPDVPRSEQAFQLYSNARKSYDPRSIDVRGVLFLAEDDRYVRMFDRSQGWGNLFSGGLDIVPVSGDHISMIRYQPHNELLARKINEMLNRIQTSRPEKDHTCPLDPDNFSRL